MFVILTCWKITARLFLSFKVNVKQTCGAPRLRGGGVTQTGSHNRVVSVCQKSPRVCWSCGGCCCDVALC